MQLSDLLPAVGELIPYDYETIRTPEYETLLAGLLEGAVSQTAPHFVQIGGIPGAGKTTFCKNSHWDERLFISFDKIGYEALRRAVEKKADIWLEHSGVNNPHIELIKNLKKKGYTTEMYFILCNLDIACRRAELREKITRRHTSREMIVKRNELVKTYLEQYKTLVDNLYIYDTSDNKFTLQSNYQKGIQIR